MENIEHVQMTHWVINYNEAIHLAPILCLSSGLRYLFLQSSFSRTGAIVS